VMSPSSTVYATAAPAAAPIRVTGTRAAGFARGWGAGASAGAWGGKGPSRHGACRAGGCTHAGPAHTQARRTQHRRGDPPDDGDAGEPVADKAQHGGARQHSAAIHHQPGGGVAGSGRVSGRMPRARRCAWEAAAHGGAWNGARRSARAQRMGGRALCARPAAAACGAHPSPGSLTASWIHLHRFSGAHRPSSCAGSCGSAFPTEALSGRGPLCGFRFNVLWYGFCVWFFVQRARASLLWVRGRRSCLQHLSPPAAAGPSVLRHESGAHPSAARQRCSSAWEQSTRYRLRERGRGFEHPTALHACVAD
jgi:hypothetical protein